MICCYNLFMAWFCSYDFDMVSVMNWDGSKLRFWCGSKLWFLCVCFFVGGCFAFFPEHVLNTYQYHIKIVLKSYQNRIKIYIKTKSLSRGWFFFFFRSQPIGNCEKAAPFPHHIKTISNLYPKPYRNHDPNHIQFITKPCRNHNLKFKTYQIQINTILQLFTILQLYQHHITIIQTHISWIWFPGDFDFISRRGFRSNGSDMSKCVPGK